MKDHTPRRVLVPKSSQQKVDGIRGERAAELDFTVRAIKKGREGGTGQTQAGATPDHSDRLSTRSEEKDRLRCRVVAHCVADSNYGRSRARERTEALVGQVEPARMSRLESEGETSQVEALQLNGACTQSGF